MAGSVCSLMTVDLMVVGSLTVVEEGGLDRKLTEMKWRISANSNT